MFEYFNASQLDFRALNRMKIHEVLRDKMQAKLDSFAALMKRQGLVVQPYDDPRLLHFLHLHPATQISVFQSFSDFVELCSEAESTGLSFKEDKSFLRLSLKRMNVEWEDSELEFVAQGDVVEIYDETFTQRFRNFKFLSLSSYELESLVCYPWYILFERDKAYTKMILDQLADVIRSEKRLTAYDVPTHLLKERYAKHGRLFEITEKYACSILSGPKKEKLAITTLQAVPVIDHDEFHKVSYLNKD